MSEIPRNQDPYSAPLHSKRPKSLGCGRLPEEPAETGAKEAVQGFYEALIDKDWRKAYASLDRQSQKRCSAPEFSRLAQRYCSNLGFDPNILQIRACEERGSEATAHVVLTGRAATHSRRYKDAITLRRGDDWHIVLPGNFGRTRRR